MLMKKVLGVVSCVAVFGSCGTMASEQIWSSSKEVGMFADKVLQNEITTPINEINSQVEAIKNSNPDLAISLIWVLKERLGSVDTEIDNFCISTLSKLLPNKSVNNFTLAEAMWNTQHDYYNNAKLKTEFDRNIVLTAMGLLYYAKNGCKSQAEALLLNSVIPAIKNSSLSAYLPEEYK